MSDRSRKEFTGGSTSDSLSVRSNGNLRDVPLKGALAAALLLLFKPAKSAVVPDGGLSVINVPLFLGSVEDSNILPSQIAKRARDVLDFVNNTKESDPAMRQLIKEFYYAGGDSKVTAAKRDTSKTPWSAAFISYLINPKRLPLPDGKIKGSLAHTDYVLATQKYLASSSCHEEKCGVYFFPTLESLKRTGPRVGDIIVSNRLDAKNSFPDVVRSSSHGALVVDYFTDSDGFYSVELIGGNESNTVLNTVRSWNDIISEYEVTSGNGNSKAANKDKVFVVMRHPVYL